MFQEALSDLFGPGVGLVGFAVMLALFLPKLVKWMRSRRAKREAREAQKPKPMGMRSMQIEPSAAAESIPDHPDHGQALECFKPDRVAILLQILCWILPLAAVLIFVSPGHRSLFAIMLPASIPLALIGLFGLSHLNDHITFYRYTEEEGDEVVLEDLESAEELSLVAEAYEDLCSEEDL